MKRFIASLFLALLLLVFNVSLGGAGQFRSLRGFRHPSFVTTNSFAFRNPSFFVINQGPFPPPQHRFVRFGSPVFFVPGQRFVVQNVVIREPFFCFQDGRGFVNEASFFEHLHRFHNIAFESIPAVIVQNGPQVFFFGR